MDLVVRTENLSKKFGSFTAVDRINLSIPPGQVCGFLGPNGAGKSTTIRMLCGILEPSFGSGEVLGYNLATDTEEIKHQIGYMSQKFSLYEDMTVLENLAFYAGLYSIPSQQRRKRMDEILTITWLKGRENDLVSVLSLGFKQRLALGCAIIANPPLLFLDEPTSGVSPIMRREFFNLIQDLTSQGTSIIVSTHFMDEAERCDQIVFFNQGKVMAMDHPDVLKQTVIKGILLEVLLDQPLEVMKEIKTWPFVQDVNLHGRLLHILVNDSDDQDRIFNLLGVKPRQIAPNLEDVFISLSKREEKAGDSL